jgi:hypothetical protein
VPLIVVAIGIRNGMKSIRECICTFDLDMSTLIWTRGKNFPLSLLASRLKCPRCGLRRIALLLHKPKDRQRRSWRAVLRMSDAVASSASRIAIFYRAACRVRFR